MFALKTLQDKWQAKYGTRYFDSRDVDRRFSTSLYGSDRLGQNCRGKRGRGWLVHRRPIGSGDGLQKHLVATRSKHPRNGWLKWVRLPPPAPISHTQLYLTLFSPHLVEYFIDCF